MLLQPYTPAFLTKYGVGGIFTTASECPVYLITPPHPHPLKVNRVVGEVPGISTNEVTWNCPFLLLVVSPIYCCDGDVLLFIGRHAASLFSTHNIQHFHLVIYFFIEVVSYCYWLSECECEPLGSCCISMLALGSASRVGGLPSYLSLVCLSVCECILSVSCVDGHSKYIEFEPAGVSIDYCSFTSLRWIVS